MTNVLELLDIAREVAADAAALAADLRSGGDIRVQATKSSDLDIVTQADTAVEALIRKRLAALRPADGILGEETGEAPGTSGITWIVDPIDGTVNYLYGSPSYAVSIAATDGRRTLAGCVHAPALGLEYTAAAGHPARRNGQELRANTEVPLAKALVSTGIPYDLEIRAKVLADFAALAPRIRDLRLVGSAALDICGVAEGRTDAHAGRRLPIWDYAAAALIATQAGAVVRGPRGGPPSLELLLAAEAPLADALEPLLTGGTQHG
ncbi:inositol monophosphatase family protein [Amycolatopsis jejuensis]|uniref:inositol monophosphatase family protein n=1 Tax=Amycolatopsis jejuensis TaxID=330084 RepID=UPI000526CE8E|nr:inositol monophosphatase family protein [Amycolatopsis jejuensis]